MNRNLFFQEKTLYTLKECQEKVWSLSLSSNFPCTEASDLNFPLYQCELMQREFTSNPYNLSFEERLTDVYTPKALALTFINKLVARYKDHYAIMCNDDSQETLIAKSKEIFTKVFNLLDYTFPKYETLLGLYESKKGNLLDKLARTRAGTRQLSTTGNNSDQHYGSGTDSSTINSVDLHNDTPQTTDVVATISGNQYVSDLKKGQTTSSGTSSDTYTNTGSSSSNGTDQFEETEGFDTMTIMAKLDEIEKQFSQLWRKWLDEFDQLFIEEVNF